MRVCLSVTHSVATAPGGQSCSGISSFPWPAPRQTSVPSPACGLFPSHPGLVPAAGFLPPGPVAVPAPPPLPVRRDLAALGHGHPACVSCCPTPPLALPMDPASEPGLEPCSPPWPPPSTPESLFLLSRFQKKRREALQPPGTPPTSSNSSAEKEPGAPQ